jgi:hypothetical protein
VINVTGSDTFPTNVRVVADGDAANAANLGAAGRDNADRTTWLAAELAAIAAGSRAGVRKIRTATSKSALQALTGMADLDVAHLYGQGLYIYRAASSTAAADPWIIAPASGGGRWTHILLSLLGQPYGLPILDANGRLTGDATGINLKSTNTLSGTLNVDGSLNIDNGASLYAAPGSATTLAGTIISGVLQFATSGIAIIKHRQATGADADATYSVASADTVFVDTLTGNRTYTVSATGADDGMRIRFVKTDVSDGHYVTLSLAGGGSNILGGASSYFRDIEYERRGTKWIKVSGFST